MKTKTIIKRVLFSVLIVFTLLVGTLVVHIATVTPKKVDNSTLQISKLDFQEPLDSIKVREIKKIFNSIVGVKKYRLNLKKQTLVYFHDNQLVNADQVYHEFSNKSNIKVSPYILPKELKGKSVCPVIDKNSISYRFTSGIQKIINH